MIAAYTKKPVTILAVEIRENDYESWLLAANFCSSLINQDEKGSFIPVDTLEGTLKARAGDWIIRGVKGEFYPCRGEIFRQTYDQVVAVQERQKEDKTDPKTESISSSLGHARNLVLDQLVPGRETSLIVTKIDEALLWWTFAEAKGITMNQEKKGN